MTYEDDEQNERFLEALRHMQARAQEETIAEAEPVLAAMPATADFPMPNTAHPALARYASAVLAYDPRRGQIRIPKPRPMMATFQMDPEPVAESAFDVAILTARKMAGPAPFVGDARANSAAYVWWAWTDDHGRHITTDSEMVWRYS